MLFKVTPVSIPNTKVKLLEADGTAWETMWESRWLLDLKCSSVAQWWSTRLLTDRLEVRALSEEPSGDNAFKGNTRFHSEHEG